MAGPRSERGWSEISESPTGSYSITHPNLPYSYYRVIFIRVDSFTSDSFDTLVTSPRASPISIVYTS